MIAQAQPSADRLSALAAPTTIHVPAPRTPVTITSADDHVEILAAEIVAKAAVVNRVLALALLLALGLVAALVLL
jgi:hypothetical protein